MHHPELTLILTGLAGLALAGCANVDQVTPMAPTAQPATSTAEITVAPPTPAPLEAVNYCLDCHADQAQLITTADPVAEMEGESKGVG